MKNLLRGAALGNESEDELDDGSKGEEANNVCVDLSQADPRQVPSKEAERQGAREEAQNEVRGRPSAWRGTKDPIDASTWGDALRCIDSSTWGVGCECDNDNAHGA